MEQTFKDRNDIRGTFGAILFIGIGLVCWWDISGISNPQAVVFPRTVIALMVAFSVVVIVRNLLGYAVPEARQPPGSVARRLGLLLAMVLGTLAMPWLGFVIAGLISYMAIMAVAMYERWNWSRRLIYPASGVAVVLGFYFIFQGLFQVPLPEPRWFSLPF